MGQFWDERKAAAAIRVLLQSDSNITLPLSTIEDAIRIDKRCPSEAECVLLVMGDEEGSVPKELANRYHDLNRLIWSQF